MRQACLLLLALSAFAQPNRRILVVTSSSADYIHGASGTLARYIRQGWRVDVAQFGNDEKVAPAGLTHALARLANVQEGKAAAKLLGVTDYIMMDLKSGELTQVSSTEMRNQLFALIRGIKPQMIFIPDPYLHYQSDHDIRKVGLMAEEAWGYSGGGTFANEFTRMGLKPYGVPEVYYYSPARPYRGGEGGEVPKAKFVFHDIADTLEQKITASELLFTRNRVYPHVRDFLTELAATIGQKHRLNYAEEFNHVGPPR